ncbi:ABC transporter permease [Salipiger marinus]|uniref:Ribose transport system permease protein n=1 Tax=Salipiger marinus TaxID=555512 RepID=A0A1G8QUC3_9RHOB|nr:ABC transporter permease [Salipiger marinus]SDJ08288.1 ribose transport system permease protein [Salipiger marinus]
MTRTTLFIRILAFAAIVAVIAGLFWLQNPAFLSTGNIRALMRHMSVNGVAALGLTFVIVVRHFDLSFPGVASLGAMTMGWLIAIGQPLSLAIGGGLAVGLLIGIFNGIAIARFKLPDIVTTIATGGLAIGFSYFYSNGTSISRNFFMSGLLDINDGRFLGLDRPFAILLGAALVGLLILNASRFGRAFYATGENRTAAWYSGVPVSAIVIAAFALCGLCACLSIVLLVASSGAANVSAGTQLLMPAFAAVYLGAALFGRPSVLATLAGTMLMSLMLNGFTLLAIPYYYSDAIVSTVLILAITCFDPRISGALRRLLPTRKETPA